MRNSLLSFLLCFLSMAVVAQNQDTSYLELSQFLNLVKENHPASVQADLITDAADAERLKASGAFDPKLFSEVDQKYFDDKTYYRLQNSGVKIPAWFGLSAKVGYQNTNGVFLNPEANTPAQGLVYGEISATVLRGLFIDERRAVLQQARVMQEASEAERELFLNELLKEASYAYWQWYEAYREVAIFSEAIDLALVRFRAVKVSAMIGELPTIDTLEAKIQYQNRLLSLKKAREKLNKARQNMATYLWLDGQIPLELEESTVPVFNVPDLSDIGLLSTEGDAQHPLLRFYQLKVEQLEIEQKLNREQLKPQVDLSYKFLSTPTEAPNPELQYSPQNYAWGLSAGFPLFLRKERGTIQKTGVKIMDTRMELDLKRRKLITKIEALQNNLAITAERLNEQRQVTRNYRQLLRAEVIKFDNGESSLFLVNQRELKYLGSREKLVALEAEIHQQIAELKALAALLI